MERTCPSRGLCLRGAVFQCFNGLFRLAFLDKANNGIKATTARIMTVSALLSRPILLQLSK